jgi:hypothetical protein
LTQNHRHQEDVRHRTDRDTEVVQTSFEIASANHRETEQGIHMKYILILTILASLGGCIITPVGHGDGYNHGYDRGDGYYRGNNYYGDRGYQGYPYRDHGG